MGQHLNIKANLAVVSLAALFLLSTSATLPAQAEARVPVAQIYPVISLNTPLARDAETFEADKTLNSACRKTGQGNAICLCVTHIMKYELTLSEYRAATRLYGQPTDRSALHSTLKDEGFKATEIELAQQMERSLIEDEDFALRCNEAKAYYKNAAN